MNKIKVLLLILNGIFMISTLYFFWGYKGENGVAYGWLCVLIQFSTLVIQMNIK